LFKPITLASEVGTFVYPVRKTAQFELPFTVANKINLVVRGAGKMVDAIKKVTGAMVAGIAKAFSWAYAKLVGFFAFAGPLAPVLAGATIAAAIAGMIALATLAASRVRRLIAAQRGFEGVIREPTLLLVAERRPEYVQVRPRPLPAPEARLAPVQISVNVSGNYILDRRGAEGLANTIAEIVLEKVARYRMVPRR